MKKTLYTLNVDNYAPEIREITLPYLKKYANRIGADLIEITERKFPNFPPVYEKLQIYEIEKERQSDWIIYIDADALVHPETIDFTHYMPRDTVGNFKCDVACLRWKYDDYFLRDGRNIGCGNWFAIGSKWCLDFWKPLDDLTLEEAIKNISPVIGEVNIGIEPSHLIDDYTLSRNVAKYGLKFKKCKDILNEIGLPDAEFFLHDYAKSIPAKVAMLQEAIKRWKI
jgi:hypothetical protein